VIENLSSEFEKSLLREGGGTLAGQ
jgi:riboflavin biosynthesis pyrimidine reductase